MRDDLSDFELGYNWEISYAPDPRKGLSHERRQTCAQHAQVGRLDAVEAEVIEAPARSEGAKVNIGPDSKAMDVRLIALRMVMRDASRFDMDFDFVKILKQAKAAATFLLTGEVPNNEMLKRKD